MNLFYMLFWLFVVLLAMYLFFRIGEYTSEKNEQNNNENNYKKNTTITTTSNDQPLEQPKVKLRSRPNAELLKLEFIDGIKEIELKYDECVKMWERILMAHPIQNKECYTFEACVFVMFQLQLLMIYVNKTPEKLQNIIVNRIFKYIKCISPYINEDYIIKRIELYSNSIQNVYYDEKFYERCMDALYALFFGLSKRAYQMDSLYDTVKVEENETISPVKVVDFLSGVDSDIMRSFLRDVNKIIDVLIENRKQKKALQKAKFYRDLKIKYHQSIEKNDYKTAKVICSKLIQHNNYDSQLYYDKAVCEFELNQYYSALKTVNAAIKLAPKFGEAYNLKATIYSQLYEYDKMIEPLTKAIELIPENDNLYYLRACVYSYMQQYHKAFDDFAIAIRKNPKNIEYYEGRAKTYAKLDMVDKFISDMDKIKKLEKKYKKA